jgi:hypothetical protein
MLTTIEPQSWMPRCARADLLGAGCGSTQFCVTGQEYPGLPAKCSAARQPNGRLSANDSACN